MAVKKTIARPISKNDVDKVMNLETERKEKGFQLGWIYFKCRDLGLLNTLEHLRDKGILESPFKQQKISQKTRLTIELVPETCWYSNVRSEVKRNEWKMLQKHTFSKANFKCEICGGRGPQWPVECHEIWQYDDTKLIQKLLGLIALCPACHEVKHRGYTNVKGRGDIADRHLAQVNGWSKDQTKQYVHEQFEVWKQRSQYEWVLDVSWLENLPFSSLKRDNSR